MTTEELPTLKLSVLEVKQLHDLLTLGDDCPNSLLIHEHLENVAYGFLVSFKELGYTIPEMSPLNIGETT